MMTNILWIHFATVSIPRTEVTEPTRVPGYFLTLVFLDRTLIWLDPTKHHLCSEEKALCGDAFYCSHQFSTGLFVASTFLAAAYSGCETWVTLILKRK